jgi:hypothetical protein
MLRVKLAGGLRLLVRAPEATGIHVHHQEVRISCHSTEDNSHVKVWRCRSTPQFSSLTGDSSVFELPEPPITGQHVLVFALAVRSTSRVNEGLATVAVQGTGILDTGSKVFEAAASRGSSPVTHEVVIHEIVRTDSNTLPMDPSRPLMILSITLEGPHLPTPGPLPKWVTRYTREEIAIGWTGERFPGWHEDLYRFTTRSDRVSNSVDWIAGRPYPIWRTAPPIITRQRLEIRGEELAKFMEAHLDAARKLVRPTSTSPLLEWAQHAANLYPLSLRFIDDLFVFCGEDDAIRDVTFPSTVFGSGDCEDAAYLVASWWVLVRDCPGLGEAYRSLQEEMRRCSQPYISATFYPLKNGKLMAHCSGVVFGPGDEGLPILLDGIQLSQSFIPESEGREYDRDMDISPRLISISMMADTRQSASTHRGGVLSERFLVVYLFDPEGRVHFLGDDSQGLLWKNLRLDRVTSSRNTPFMDDRDSWRLKPQPRLTHHRVEVTESPQGLDPSGYLIVMTAGNAEKVGKKIADIWELASPPTSLSVKWTPVEEARGPREVTVFSVKRRK